MNEGNKHARVCLLCQCQNRHCNNDCEYGEFFKPHRNEDFQSALRSLGLSNIMSMMESVETYDRQGAANSILSQGRAWQRRQDGRQLEMGEEISSFERKALFASTFMAFCRYYAKSAPFPIMSRSYKMAFMQIYKMNGIPTACESGESR
jgi:hypothetical protein